MEAYIGYGLRGQFGCSATVTSPKDFTETGVLVITDLFKIINEKMRILGIDYGDSKIGLAIGETDANLASPFVIVQNNDSTIELLQKYVKDENVEKIVVGIPYGESYEITAQAEKVQKFIIILNDNFSIPIDTVDERYSTTEAKRLMKEGSIKGEDDMIAAMLLLQAYMDKK